MTDRHYPLWMKDFVLYSKTPIVPGRLHHQYFCPSVFTKNIPWYWSDLDPSCFTDLHLCPGDIQRGEYKLFWYKMVIGISNRFWILVLLKYLCYPDGRLRLTLIRQNTFHFYKTLGLTLFSMTACTEPK